MASKKDIEKKFICRACAEFFDEEDLDKGKCPTCKTDERVFINDLLDTDDDETESKGTL